VELSETLHELYSNYNGAVVLMIGENEHGDVASGTGFHVGNGIIVTAAHVACLAKRRILAGDHPRGRYELESGATHCHEDETIDLAVIQTDFEQKWLGHFHPRETLGPAHAPFIPIGGHLDDWLDNAFILTRVILMGFPSVPLTREMELLAVAGEVNAIVDKYSTPHPYFIISSIPRGGFSGGPVIQEWNFLLGVLTESLTTDANALETGFAAVLTVEPLLVLLGKNRLRPRDIDDEIWSLFIPEDVP
jgi:hypothetical protein